jgi:cell division protein FtsL
MRATTLLAIALIGALVTGLYHLKQRVQAAERRLASVNQSIVQDRQAIHVLRAEWAYLARPSRLERLAARHLKLEPIKPSQIRAFDELPAQFAPTNKNERVEQSAKAGAKR